MSGEIDENIKELSGKPPLELLALFYPALAEVCHVGAFGNTKYKPNSWVRVPIEHYKGAALRHLLKAFAGEDLDPESGRAHLAHAAWNCLAMLTLAHLDKKQLKGE